MDLKDQRLQLDRCSLYLVNLIDEWWCCSTFCLAPEGREGWRLSLLRAGAGRQSWPGATPRCEIRRLTLVRVAEVRGGRCCLPAVAHANPQTRCCSV